MKDKKILVPTDFSKNAEAALKFAIGLGREFQTHLIILHAYRLVQTTVSSVDQSPFSLKNQWDKDTWEKFRNLEEKLIKGVNISYDFEVDVGFASDAIISAAEANDIDIIIMGAAGTGAMSQVLGSTTLKIIDQVKLPILVIPPGVDYTGIQKIIFAYDNKKIRELTKLQILKDCVNSFKANLEILNISSDKKLVDKNVELLKSHFIDTEPTFTTIASESIEEGILNHLKGKTSHLLVALKRDHSLMEKIFSHSVTRKLVLHSEFPILVLHES